VPGCKQLALKRTTFAQFDESTWLPGIVARHTAFFFLLAVLLGQLLLLSVQVTRNQNVRLINVWAAEIFGPFEQGCHSIIEGTVQSWASVHALWADQKANNKLGSELVLARAKIHKLSEEAAEADRLKALLQFKAEVPFKSVAAQVIAASPEDGLDSVVIDRGKDASIKPNMPVITPEGVVGKVAAVYAHTAQILLITDPSCGVGCMLEQSRIQGILMGNGRDRCDLRYVMDDQKVPAGAAVITSGLDQVYPRGLLVGHVVRSENGNIYRKIIVKPAASLSRLETVLVLFKSISAQGQGSNSPHH